MHRITSKFHRHLRLGAQVAEGGFTLLEMLVSTGIFAVLIVSAVGVVISIGTAQHKASGIQNIQDNLRFALEFMTKELRQGSSYLPANCVVVTPQGLKSCTKIQFTARSGQRVWYCAAGGVILRRVDTADSCETQGSPLTSGEILISNLKFYVIGDAPGPSDGQPRVTIILQGTTQNAQAALQTRFNLETTVTQRIRDL